VSENNHAYWNQVYAKSAAVPVYDGILVPYLPKLTYTDTIVDLGCGNGVNTQYLTAQGFHPIACDFSEEALSNLKARLPQVETRCFDMTNPFPFADNSVDFLLADLSLHYFTKAETENVIGEIFRVLKPGKLLLCRVNAYAECRDSDKKVKIEEDFYFGSYRKRFFSCESLAAYLTAFRIERLENTITGKYGSEKFAVLCAARKP